MRHKHADLICAWANGEIIETLSCDNIWVVVAKPSWDYTSKYRIQKPCIIYRKFLWKTQFGKITLCVCTADENQNEPRDKWSGFIKWIGGWEEVLIDGNL